MEQLPGFSVRINRGKYVNKIGPINIPKARRNQLEDKITPNELQQLRDLCGSLQYAAVHSRPDIATKVAKLQKGINQATVETLLEGNRVLREAQAFSETSVIVRPLPIGEVCFASFGDASFASAKQLNAQQELFIMARTPKWPRMKLRSFRQSYGIPSRFWASSPIHTQCGSICYVIILR